GMVSFLASADSATFAPPSARFGAGELVQWSVIKRFDGPPRGSVLFGQHLRLRFSVRIEPRLLAFRPGCSLLRAADLPIGTAALQHGAQVEAQFLHRRPAEEPVAVVDLVDTQAGLEHQR